MRARKLVAALSVYSMLLSQVPFEGITALTANLAPDVPVAVAQTTSSGDFQFEQLSLGSKYQITWLTTITCRNPNGTTQTYLGLDGRGILVELGIPNLVAKAIRDKNLNYTQPTKPLVSSRGGGGGGNRWTIGTPEVETLNAVCKILGSPQDTYVSFDCHDGERGQYPAGKCNYHSPADDPPNDDKMMRFVGPFVIPQCQDGIDNDGDGKTDFPQDPGCSNNQDDDEGPFNAQCGDGIDNDGDGAVDYPNDFSCSSRTDDDETNPKSQCQDGVDNDGDGKTDFPQDPGCSSKQDNDEGPFNGQCGDGVDNDNDGAADFPNDFSCSSTTDDDETNPKSQCQDGVDNDGDGKTDFPQDPGCSSKQDNDEGPFNGQCGDGIDNDGDGAVDYPNDFSCSSSTDDDETNPKAQCQDGIDNDGDVKTDFPQDPGCSSKQDNDEGPFNGQCGDGIDNDGDGATDFPNDFSCSSSTDDDETNPKSQCQDGIDNDNDGRIDFPQDPGCTSKQDNDESNEPQCQNNKDDDGDGATDYPNDFSCSSATDTDETNPKSQCQDGVDNDGDGKTDFGTAASNDPGCVSKQDNDEFNAATADLSISKSGPTTVNRGSTVTYTLIGSNAGPNTATNITISDAIPTGLTFNAAGSDASCVQNGTSILCNNFSLAAGQLRTVRVAFNVPSTVACGSTIQNRAAISTSITDPNPNNNQSSTISTTVNCVQCSDGVDNDNDGATDYPADFSCSNASDTDETNPKAQCQDGIDNDADGLIDFPNDPGCASKQDNDENNSAVTRKSQI